MSKKDYVGNDPRIIKLCTECKRVNCNGNKCDEYLELERFITAEHDLLSRAPGQPESSPKEIDKKTVLRLYNQLIGMLEELKNESDIQRQRQIDPMVRALRKWRMETFESGIDWHAMEERI